MKVLKGIPIKTRNPIQNRAPQCHSIYIFPPRRKNMVVMYTYKKADDHMYTLIQIIFTVIYFKAIQDTDLLGLMSAQVLQNACCVMVAS